jgi:hypothetical protein
MVELLLYIQELPASYLGPETAYRGLSQTLEPNAGLVPHITTRSLTSTSTQFVAH